MKASGLEDGYARDADGVGNVLGELVGEGGSVGRGCWIEREGRESLREGGYLVGYVSCGFGNGTYLRTFRERE
jgi:hypothetical protein